MALLLILPILIASSCMVQTAPNPGDKCFTLYKDLNAFLMYDKVDMGEQISNVFKQVTGVDPADKDAIYEFACKLAEIRTIRELADLLPLPYDQVRAMYLQQIQSIVNTGGVEAMVNHLKMRVRIISEGKKENLTHVDFTSFPIQAPREALRTFFGTLKSEFGSNFLDWVYHQGEFRDQDKYFILEDVDGFVDALITSNSDKEAGEKTGFDAFKLWSMLGALKNFLLEHYGVYESYIDLTEAFKDFGLMDLRDE